jgi:hypothetical protein
MMSGMGAAWCRPRTEETKMTRRKIDNAANRAAKLAHEVVNASQIAHFAASDADMRSERGDAANAAAMAAAALQHLAAGEYSDFQTCLSLAGQFNQKARDAAYKRIPRALKY